MSIDKFGHHISSYHRHQYEYNVDNLGNYTYKILLRFESDKIDSKTKNYILFQTQNYWQFQLERGVIRHIRAHPGQVIIIINEERYFAEEIKDIFLKKSDKISFVGVEKEHLFVEMLVECPISFDSFSE